MKQPLLLILGSIILISAACDEEISIPPQESYRLLPNVFCILNPASQRQWLILERTMRMEETAQDIYGGRIWGARVSISDGAKRVDLVEDENEPGLYYTDSLQVVPGRRYTLKILDRYQNVVTGETVVPSPIKIIEPQPGTYPLGTEITVRWTASPNTAHYVINIHHFRARGWGTPYFITSRDTSRSISPLILQYPGDYLIQVLAPDENYFQYFLTNNQTESTQVPLMLTGGLGVFGSATADTVHIVMGQSNMYVQE